MCGVCCIIFVVDVAHWRRSKESQKNRRHTQVPPDFQLTRRKLHFLKHSQHVPKANAHRVDRESVWRVDVHPIGRLEELLHAKMKRGVKRNFSAIKLIYLVPKKT